MSYVQFAMEGLRHQMSQGAANWTVEPGDRFTFYKLVDSTLPRGAEKVGHETSFFDGIDTTWPGLASHFDSAETKLPDLKSELTKIGEFVAEASGAQQRETTPPLQSLP